MNLNNNLMIYGIWFSDDIFETQKSSRDPNLMGESVRAIVAEHIYLWSFYLSLAILWWWDRIYHGVRVLSHIVATKM